MHSRVPRACPWVSTFKINLWDNLFSDYIVNDKERSCDMLRKLVLAVLTVIYLIVLTGCHTLHGVGKDVESAGESIQKATD